MVEETRRRREAAGPGTMSFCAGEGEVLKPLDRVVESTSTGAFSDEPGCELSSNDVTKQLLDNSQKAENTYFSG